MEVQQFEQKPMIEVTKNSTGIHWRFQVFAEQGTKADDLIKKAKIINEKLMKEFPSK